MSAPLVAEALRHQARALEALADVLDAGDGAERLLTTDEVADRLGLQTVETVRRMIERGELRAVKVGSHWRITPSALAEFLEARS